MLVLLVVLAGCAATPGEPPIGPVPAVVSGADVKLPLDRFQQTAEEHRLLADAVAVVGDRCMRRFGLTWQPDTSTPSFSNEGRYTNLDLAAAAARGYHAPTSPDFTPPPVSPEVRTVWLGEGDRTFRGLPVPSGGCVGETMRQLKPGIDQIRAGLPQQLQFQSFGMTRQDSRVQRAYASWSSCMADKGFHYPDPPAAVADPRWNAQWVTPQETATAVADVECKVRTNVAGVMLAVETAYQARLIAQNEDALDAVMAFAEKEEAIAREVLTSTSR